MERNFEFKPIRSKPKDKINVIVYGLGSIGMEVARALLEKDDLEIVAAVDKDVAKVGMDVGKLIGWGKEMGIRVSDGLGDISKTANPYLVLHTTASSFKDVYPQLSELAEAGMDVVSSSEELSFPYLQNPDLAQRLDRLCLEKGVTILGTGVNPGFVMDLLPLFATEVCQDVETIRATRVVDATTRRGPLQSKIGSGMDLEEFNRLAELGKIGHAGLVESVALIAHGLGWELDTVGETLNPIVSQDDIVTPHVEVKKGQVAGIKQRGFGMVDGVERIVLDLEMRLKAPHPHDAVVIMGNPGMNLRIEGGTAGDQATVGVLINAIPRVMAAGPGLLTGVDLPVKATRL